MVNLFSGRCSGGLALAILAALCSTAGAAVWNVSTVSGLENAVFGAGPGDEIVVAPGTYNLTRVLQMNTPNVSIRGATGVREDVVIVGGGMNTRGVDEGITVGADNVSISSLTLKDFYYNAIHIRAESDADNTIVSNVKTWNIGERHIKGSRDSNPSHVADNALIENVYMLQTIPRAGHPDTGDDYIGGIDAMSLRNWVIRDCVAEGIRGETGGGNAAIFLWQGVDNVTIERNTIIDCCKGIGIGLCYGPGFSICGDWHSDGGVIRNNTILRTTGQDGNNIGLELCKTKDMKVYNNTVYTPNSYFRNLSVWDDANAQCDGLELVNNIFRGGVYDIAQGDWSAAAVAAMGNIVDETLTFVLPEWFVDPANGDFHLTDLAVPAIDTAVPLGLVPDDIDGQLRPIGDLPDYGADEYLPEPATVLLLAAAGLGVLRRRRWA